MYYLGKNRQHKDKLFDKIAMNTDLVVHEMTNHQSQLDFYQNKQYVHQMDRRLNK